jgi:hypothetical protein
MKASAGYGQSWLFVDSRGNEVWAEVALRPR